MVRNYVRKTNRGSYGRDALLAAANDVQNNGVSKRSACKTYNIPRPTLQKFLKNPDHVPISLGRFTRVFNDNFENELCTHALEMQSRFYGLTYLDLRSLALQLAERNGIAHPFAKGQKLAGKTWLHSFMRRHSELTLRSPEPTSMARIAGFNRIQVGKFFENLTLELTKVQYSPAQIYNVDETGITTVQKPGKIIAKKGLKQVGKAVSSEKGMTTTVVCAMNVSFTTANSYQKITNSNF